MSEECKHTNIVAYTEDGARYQGCRDCHEAFPQPSPTEEGPPIDMFGNDLARTDSVFQLLVKALQACRTDLKAAIDRLPPRLHDHEDVARCKALLAQIDAALKAAGVDGYD
jgi:hypothetical protein